MNRQVRSAVCGAGLGVMMAMLVGGVAWGQGRPGPRGGHDGPPMQRGERPHPQHMQRDFERGGPHACPHCQRPMPPHMQQHGDRGQRPDERFDRRDHHDDARRPGPPHMQRPFDRDDRDEHHGRPDMRGPQGHGSMHDQPRGHGQHDHRRAPMFDQHDGPRGPMMPPHMMHRGPHGPGHDNDIHEDRRPPHPRFGPVI